MRYGWICKRSFALSDIWEAALTQTHTDLAIYSSRVRGSILGGAIGDALGNPVEFASSERIHRDHPRGVRTFASAIGEITDDTQMTMFTLEGMIRAHVRTERGIGFTLGVIHHAYQRWLDTQELREPSGERDGWLAAQQWLYVQRSPGGACLSALQASKGKGFGMPAENNKRGCGGVMRSAPFGLVPPRVIEENVNEDWPFESAATCASYTHGHPTGQLAAAALAAIIQHIVAGGRLEPAVDFALSKLQGRPDAEQTIRALLDARALAGAGPSVERLESLGGGFYAEEALAIAVYAALCFPSHDQVLDGLSFAVSHSGDSDSTGSICGNILGALHGVEALPTELAARVEGRGTILELVDDFIASFLHGPEALDFDRYPGW